MGNLYVLHFLWMPVIIALDPNDVEVYSSRIFKMGVTLRKGSTRERVRGVCSEAQRCSHGEINK